MLKGVSKAGRPGRKTKAAGIRELEVRKLIRTLKPYDKTVVTKLMEAIDDGEGWAIKLFMEYRFGKPLQEVYIEKNVRKQTAKTVIQFVKSEAPKNK